MSSWRTAVIDGIPVLEAAVIKWAEARNVDLSNSDLIRKMYNWIDKAKPQGFGQSMATKQVRLNIC